MVSEPELLNYFYECFDRHKESAKRAKLRWHDHAKASDATQQNQQCALRTAHPIHAAIMNPLQAWHCRSTLSTLVDAINEQLKLLSLRIAKSKSKSSSGEMVAYYGVVNMNAEDAFAQVANSLSKVEQEFFHKCAPSS